MTGGAEPALARLGGRWAHDLVEVSHDLGVLDESGRWAVVLPYVGPPVLLRFRHWTPGPPEWIGRLAHRAWQGPLIDAWTSSMTRDEYLQAVATTREAIGAGTIYQANICRVLSAEVPSEHAWMPGLDRLLQVGNRAPFAGFIDAPEAGTVLATASPELFLERQGHLLRTGPIKGTAATASELLSKDWAENVMIVDLMRNDLSRVCQAGSVTVPALTRLESHPGLVHLVSTVQGELVSDVGWAETVAATFPPGSVTGAPKSSALTVIEALEPAAREVYCGAIGWVDADRRQACLAVAIRTFWYRDGLLRFGTGAGITWDSDPELEWAETQLKARRLIAVAAGANHADVTGFSL